MERPEHRACRERTPQEDRAVRDAMMRRMLADMPDRCEHGRYIGADADYPCADCVADACECDPALYVDPACESDHWTVTALSREIEGR